MERRWWGMMISFQNMAGSDEEEGEDDLDKDQCMAEHTTLYCICIALQELATSLLLCKMHLRVSFS